MGIKMGTIVDEQVWISTWIIESGILVQIMYRVC